MKGRRPRPLDDGDRGRTRVSLIINTTKLIRWQTSGVSIISNCTTSAIKDAANSLREGNLVAFPTETVYGLGADAQNKDAVAKIYQAKGRPVEHPLIVHISSVVHLKKWTRNIPEYAIKLAESFWPGPMTLILPRTEVAKDFITGGQDNVGIRVPSHGIAQELLKNFEAQGGLGIAAPSANRFGKVSTTSALGVQDELAKYLTCEDLILDGGHCQVGLESTIIDCRFSAPTILRPGAISEEMVNAVSGIGVISNKLPNQIKAPGLLQSHYAPEAKVFLTGTPGYNEGFIALGELETPNGAIRLASPENSTQFAQQLYLALRLADKKKLKKIFIVAPDNGALVSAINDRLKRMTQ